MMFMVHCDAPGVELQLPVVFRHGRHQHLGGAPDPLLCR
jgi:hypothetical protein